MNIEQVQEIIFRVLSESGEQKMKAESSVKIPVEVSAKHVHLTESAVKLLFGTDAKLTERRPLSQPGQFLSEERVTLVTPKGRIENVAVLGPARGEIQVELSVTDCKVLGLKAPLRMSGDLSGAADVYIIGPKGMIEARGSVIVAQAHIHMTPMQAIESKITDGQSVSVTVGRERPMTFENVVCRVDDSAGLAMHIDFDEANACMLAGNETASIQMKTSNQIARTERMMSEREMPGNNAAVQELTFEGKLITEEVARKLAAEERKALIVAKNVILTPSARDVLNHAGIKVLQRMGG